MKQVRHASDFIRLLKLKNGENIRSLLKRIPPKHRERESLLGAIHSFLTTHRNITDEQQRASILKEHLEAVGQF